VSVPDPYAALVKAMSAEDSITDLLLPQAALPGLTVPPIFALSYPRKEAGVPAGDVRSFDWTALLQARAIRMLLISPSGRVPSGGDTSRAPWSRPRFDVLSYGPTYSAASAAHWAVYAFLKDLSRVRAVLSSGTALIHDATVEGGPISFPDPDTDSPVMVGIYAASMAEEFVSVA
jgi:hypothetical protein